MDFFKSKKRGLTDTKKEKNLFSQETLDFLILLIEPCFEKFQAVTSKTTKKISISREEAIYSIYIYKLRGVEHLESCIYRPYI